MPPTPGGDAYSHFLTRHNNTPARQDADALAAAQYALELDRHLDRMPPDPAAAVELASDTYQAGTIHKGVLGRDGVLKFGRIQYSYPYTNWYRVAVADGYGTLPCVKLTGDAHTLGMRDTTVIAPDTEVLVFLSHTGLYGTILGSIPALVEDGSFVFSDWVAQGSNVGIKRDEYYTQYIEMLEDEGGVLDHSGGRPLDELAYDWGKISEQGGGIHADPYMFWLRIDETTGVYGFQHDQMLRVLGHNLEVISGAHEERFRDDEGECTQFRGETPYPWEVLGAPAFGVTVSREIDDVDVHWNKPFGKFEPAQDDQQPFYRYNEYGGYLGQAKIRAVTLWPQSTASCPDDCSTTGSSAFVSSGSHPYNVADGVNRYSHKTSQLGVFREQISLDGGYGLESAKHVVIAKRGLIPHPKRIKPDDDYTVGSQGCDSVENNNYRFAGLHPTAAAAHKIGDIENCEYDDADKSLKSVAAVLDMHAHLFNWKGTHAFHYHKGDYDLPEETELSLDTNQYIPPFSELQNKMWLDRPDPSCMYVDHRYNGGKPVRFYEVLSHITLTEDGGVVIQGGQGEEIRMVGGSIQISCPGNIIIQPGRQAITLAGDDAIIRAKRSIDITSSDADVRLKAERNMQLLAGNGTVGGSMLLENRSTDLPHNYTEKGGEDVSGSGIIFKAAHSQISALGQSIYLRTGNSEGGIGSGDIVLDASKGTRDILQIARNHNRLITEIAQDKFTESNNLQNVRSANIYTQYNTRFGKAVDVFGVLRAKGQFVADSTIIAVNSDFLSANGSVSRLRNRDVFEAQMKAIEAQAKKDAVLDSVNRSIVDGVHSSGKVGNDDVQQAISFSLRTPEQMGTEYFKLPEVHWQILNEAGNKAGTVWAENTVSYRNDERMPWPGKDNWTKNKTFLRMPPSAFKMYDIAKGVAKPRPAPYEDAKYGDFEKAVPAQTYKVIG